MDTLEVKSPPAIAPDGEVKSRDLVLIWYSGELEKTWASLILATTAAACSLSSVPEKRTRFRGSSMTGFLQLTVVRARDEAT